MTQSHNIQPPKWAVKFLQWYCKPELLEDLQGDLYEYFDRNVKSKGASRARLIYIIDVLKFFRPYTIRKPEFINSFINFIMIGSFVKTSGRNLVRNKLFSFINIFGLAVSMSVGLVLIGVLMDILSYDKFHEHHERIYRVISRYQYLGDKDNNFVATTSAKAGRLIKEQFTGVEEVAMVRNDFQGDFQAGVKTMPLSGLWAAPSFFNVFSFKLLKGNSPTALQEPFSVVLTETAAYKLFGNEEPLGKTIILDNDRSYTVTGVMQDVPFFSHMKFEIIGSMATREIIAKEDVSEEGWDDVWSTWVYILSPENFNANQFKTNLDSLSKKEDAGVENTHIELRLQAMDSIMIGDTMSNQIGPVLGGTLIWVFSGLAFIVILSACFNYTNLSIARSLRRAREVGVRKVIGAMRSHVILQFIVEAVIISLCALLIAIALFFLLRPHFLSIEPEVQKIFTLRLSPLVFLYFFFFAVVVGVLAGIFPSLFFAQVKAIQVLRGSITSTGLGKIAGRKTLIVIQYCISIMLISASIGVYRQYQHYLNFDLGFSTENILNISLQGNKSDVLKKELQELPEVKAISLSLMVTSLGTYYGTYMKYHGSPNDSSGVGFNSIDENYLPLHGHSLIAGKNFEIKPDSANETEVIVNQQVLKRFNIAGQDPEKALGDVLHIDGNDLTIIGVMKDFQYARANTKLSKEIVFRYSKTDQRLMNVKVHSQDLVATRAKIEAIWKQIDPVHPFEAKFYDEQLQEAFAGLRATVKLAGFLAFLAICIASLGLLGMVVFTTEIRFKEISIRKVMGAREGALIYLLGKGFVFLLLIATVISLPVVILFFEKVILPNTANPASLNISEILLGVLIIFLLALGMIVSQTLKVAMANPAEVLKAE